MWTNQYAEKQPQFKHPEAPNHRSHMATRHYSDCPSYPLHERHQILLVGTTVAYKHPQLSLSLLARLKASIQKYDCQRHTAMSLLLHKNQRSEIRLSREHTASVPRLWHWNPPIKQQPAEGNRNHTPSRNASTEHLASVNHLWITILSITIFDLSFAFDSISHELEKPNPNMGLCPNAQEAWKEVSTKSRFGLISRFKWTLNFGTSWPLQILYSNNKTLLCSLYATKMLCCQCHYFCRFHSKSCSDHTRVCMQNVYKKNVMLPMSLFL